MIEQYTKKLALKSIIGPIQSVGITEVDAERFENLKEFKGVIIELTRDLLEECRNVKRYEHSMKQSGKLAIEIARELERMITEVFDDLLG